ncbi:MAG TPA: hypothetical protein PKN49_09860, partial [Candidatus Aminicenantes bacterium]|nr:hypothetical protein [Candidatus Aminicenantes bacterium]
QGIFSRPAGEFILKEKPARVARPGEERERARIALKAAVEDKIVAGRRGRSDGLDGKTEAGDQGGRGESGQARDDRGKSQRPSLQAPKHRLSIIPESAAAAPEQIGGELRRHSFFYL